MISEQDRLQFWDLVQSLDPDLCSVLIGHDIDGTRMVDIAERHGMALSTAYKWRSQALAALEAIAREEEHDCSVPRVPRAAPSAGIRGGGAP
jgi:RNA polymerase sigma-70 factor (ECF subfamily)